MRFRTRFLILAASSFWWAIAARTAERVHNFSHWEPEVAAYESRDKANPPPQDAILFAGSSTIRFWSTLASDFPGHPVINRGFGGTEIVDSTHFADRLIFPHRPHAIFLRAGVNDIHDGKTPAEVFADFQDFVRVIHARLPECEIYFIGLCPTISRWTEAEANHEVDRLVEGYVKTVAHVHYIDAWDMSLDANGKPRPELFRDDKLHFSPAGYKILVDRVRPYVR
ncbi:MAG TPA: GDSL-type esterase/lipase family protein [Candidatus Didemnitutus sp.]|nr:GDSL-type esterase/lipase family protein [Candidatus Didemnitutus sp.]